MIGDETSPVFYIFAGINGSGKTSFYKSISDNTFLGVRVSIDELTKASGDLNDPMNILRCGKKCLQNANECIEKGTTFNEETTLPGKVIEKQLITAGENNFTSVMYYIGVDGVDMAIARVRRRIELGGHSVPEELIRKRFSLLPSSLSVILPLIDYTFVFDNTVMFRQIALLERNRIKDLYDNPPDWFFETFGFDKNKYIHKEEN